MADINKVWLSGVVVTQPVLTQLSSKVPFTSFLLQVNEQYKDYTGRLILKPNIIKIESLGKSAETTVVRVKKGGRYTVDGYIRQDSDDTHDFFRVRIFAIYPDESNEQGVYQNGLKQALSILKASKDVASAMGKIEELLNF